MITKDCTFWRTIWLEPSDVDVISDELARQLLEMNEKGEAICRKEP